jgi:hypothetical protein
MKRLLIPLFFMALAALACDAPVYDVPRILGVSADAETAGKVYAEVGNSEARAAYVSQDYGRTWQRTAEAVETNYNEDYSMQGDTLYYEGNGIWLFPRPTFRFFFLNDEDREYFALPLWSQVSASEAHGVLYVGMGTEGVLIFTAPGEWHLSAEGIDRLDPIPLTITDPPTLAGIIALALLIPPLGLLHAYLLTRVWLYALPSAKAWRVALTATGIITLLAVVAIVVWLTDARTDYYPVVAVMTLVTVILSVGAALIAVPEQRARQLAWRTALVSLVVPAGVASIWWGWLIIIPLLTVYAIYRYAYARKFKEDSTVSPGLLDQLTFLSLLPMLGAALVIGAFAFVLGGGRGLSEFFILVLLLVLIYTSYSLTHGWVMRRLRAYNLNTSSLRRTISVATILCYVLAPILAVAVFFGQGYAYNWFTTLLVP